MPKQEHHPWDRKSYYKGAQPDVDPDLLGSKEKDDGTYYDAYNMRQSDGKDGFYGDLVPIGGEKLIDDGRGEKKLFRCIGAYSVNDHLVEFWAHSTSSSEYGGPVSEPPHIIVDGQKVAESEKLGFTADHPLQGDVNESCVGGEVYVTDDNTTPKVFNIQDLLDSLGTDKYFGNYDPAYNSVNLSKPADIPVFVGLKDLGGANGLPVGEYRYSLRYVTEEGDRTNWSAWTPMVQVPRHAASDLQGTKSDKYPGSMAGSDDPNSSSKSNYGAIIKFRVTNLFGYSSIEIKREAWNQGQGGNFTPSPRVVYRVGVDEGEVSVVDFIDPVDSNVSEEISDTEDTQELTLVQNAKGIRYYDRRLHLFNIETVSKTVDSVGLDTFDTGAKAIPKVDKLGKVGYNDAWNKAYRERFMSGEKYSFGVVFFDSLGGRSFAKEAIDNFHFPDRRDKLEGDSQLFSYGTEGSKAADVNNEINFTFEVFDLYDAQSKPKTQKGIGIVEKNSAGTGGVKAASNDKFPMSGASSKHSDSNIGSNILGQYLQEFSPFKPTPIDRNVDEHSFNPTVQVENDYTGGGPGTTIGFEYSPKGFGPNYHSMGLAVKGVNNIPEWAQAFSVVRSEPAGRVFCQGLGMFALIPGEYGTDGTHLQKHQDRMWFYSSDVESSKVNIKEVMDNPSGFEVQMVSPLGFFTEWYNFNSNAAALAEDKRKDRIVDMISYANIIRDSLSSSEINDRDLFGIPGTDGHQYVAFGMWRNIYGTSAPWTNTTTPGKQTIPISSVQTVQEGRNTYYELRLKDNVWAREHFGGPKERWFHSEGNRKFFEPFYMVNIVRKNAQVSDDNIDQYKPTSHYQKVESIIGRSDGTEGQSFELIDERWEDVIVPDFYPDQWRYVYVGGNNQQKQAWTDVTKKSSSEINTIKNDIQSNGYWVSPEGVKVYGIYTYESLPDPNGYFRYYIQFDDVDHIPKDQELIYVRYDDRMPLSVYGGGAVVAPDVFAPVDREASGDFVERDKNFIFDAGWPYFGFNLAPNYFQLTRTSVPNVVQDENAGHVSYVRQLAMMFIGESYSDEHMKYINKNPYSEQFFPEVHYVIRPHKNFDPNKDLSKQFIFSDWLKHYPGEKNIWKWGGFRFHGMRNPDHFAEPYSEYFSKPEQGFKEENDFCTLAIWSLRRPINVQDAPGLRTFPATNKFFVSDDQGEIKFAYDQMTSKGRNLFVVTTSGVCMLMTNKSVLSDKNADEIAYIGNDDHISQEYWISKEIGARDHYWQGRAEGRIRMAGENRSAHGEILLWPDKSGVYQLMNGEISELLRGNYFSKISPVLEKFVHDRPQGMVPMRGVIDERNNEYWLHIQSEVSDDARVGRAQRYSAGRHLYVLNLDTGNWSGRFGYSFDEYVYHDDIDRVVGLRDNQAYRLDEGSEILGESMTALVEQISSGVPDLEHEWIRIRVNTERKRGTNRGKPQSIEFLDEDGAKICEISQSVQGSYYLKLYDGWENFIPREDASYSSKRRRLQSSWLRYRIRFDNLEELVLKSTNVQLKPLK